ncbi:MAG: hypothetical protein PHV74_03560 [Dehalococcoidia bacterium]|nr:hypothetical protein [Dehalococcoidia bacterium]
MASKFRLALVIAMISILIVGVVGCGDDDDGGTSNGDNANGIQGVSLTKATLLEKVSAISSAFETYELQADMKMDMNGWDGEAEEEISMNMSMDMLGAMDIPGEKMKMIMNMTMKLPEEAQEFSVPEDMQMEMYLIGNTMYMNMGEMLGGWMKMDVPDSELGAVWEEQNWVNQQTDMLLKAFNFEVVGEKTVNGVACYEVTMEPDMMQLLGLLGEQLGDFMPEDMDASEMSEAMEMFKDFSVRQWYDKKTFLPVRSEIEMNLMDEEENIEMNIAMEMNIKYTSINQPVSIDLPNAAKNAVNMGEWSEAMS